MSTKESDDSADSGIGFFGSPYSPANAMLTPGDIGVKVGDSMSDVFSAVKSVGYYTDMIGFGAPSTPLTMGMPLKPLGVNYFIKTGVQCSNGANMWHYMKGIPDGNALGDRVKYALDKMGLPPLKGLAPAMVEDAQNALNPIPMVNALVGTGYPQCQLVTEEVGDAYGNIKDPFTGEEWISDPLSAEPTWVADSTMPGGGYNKWRQKKWVQAVNKYKNPINLTKEQWDTEPKIYDKDGNIVTDQNDGFINYMIQPSSFIVIGVLCLLALGFVKH